jgi:hypothetical protein
VAEETTLLPGALMLALGITSNTIPYYRATRPVETAVPGRRLRRGTRFKCVAVFQDDMTVVVTTQRGRLYYRIPVAGPYQAA